MLTWSEKKRIIACPPAPDASRHVKDRTNMHQKIVLGKKGCTFFKKIETS